jgi:hypothetical protein
MPNPTTLRTNVAILSRIHGFAGFNARAARESTAKAAAMAADA